LSVYFNIKFVVEQIFTDNFSAHKSHKRLVTYPFNEIDKEKFAPNFSELIVTLIFADFMSDHMKSSKNESLKLSYA
jgi:hypothetical protein